CFGCTRFDSAPLESAGFELASRGRSVGGICSGLTLFTRTGPRLLATGTGTATGTFVAIGSPASLTDSGSQYVSDHLIRSGISGLFRTRPAPGCAELMPTPAIATASAERVEFSS